jgi:hypothetical protein
MRKARAATDKERPMGRTKLTEADLRRELQRFHESFPKLADDQLFVLWFMRAFLVDDEDEAVRALTGGPNDKGVDAVLVDQRTRTVLIVQGKYREKIGGKNESRADLVSFAKLAEDLAGESGSYGSFCKGLAPAVKTHLDHARKHLLKDDFRLRLHYVTTGTCSRELAREANRLAQAAHCPAALDVIGGPRVLQLLDDYLGGVAPPVPSLDLPMESGKGVDVKGVFHRYDHKTRIESWVFSMTAEGIAELFEQAGDRLFARNVRGFLGNTEINRGMEVTLQKEPGLFWYYNNGITIICDQAEEISTRGHNVLRVQNPQVINGQQTTRVLSKMAGRDGRASVLIRVISVHREESSDSADFDALVSQIVGATNWQNAIRASDLMSNDRRQVEIERQLRKLGYWYIRKRQTKNEAKKAIGALHYFMLPKDDLARAVAACDLDPATVREGKENLFEERFYSRVFPTADPYFYLSRYWLMREVSYMSRGYPDRAYAKWLVLNFLWSCQAPIVRAQAGAERFRVICERDGADLYDLERATDAAFKAALQLYRAKRGKGPKRIDISSFFKRHGLDVEFARFWKGSRNSHRGAFNRAWHRWEKALAAESR